MGFINQLITGGHHPVYIYIFPDFTPVVKASIHVVSAPNLFRSGFGPRDVPAKDRSGSSTDSMAIFPRASPHFWRVWLITYPLVNIQKTDGKIAMLLMGKSTISMAIFHSYVSLPEGTTMTIPIAPTVTSQVVQKIPDVGRPHPKNHQTRARSRTGAPLMGLKPLLGVKPHMTGTTEWGCFMGDGISSRIL